MRSLLSTALSPSQRSPPWPSCQRHHPREHRRRRRSRQPTKRHRLALPAFSSHAEFTIRHISAQFCHAAPAFTGLRLLHHSSPVLPPASPRALSATLSTPGLASSPPPDTPSTNINTLEVRRPSCPRRCQQNPCSPPRLKRSLRGGRVAPPAVAAGPPPRRRDERPAPRRDRHHVR